MINILPKLWETKELLLNHISKNSLGIVVGSATEAPRGYYSCAVDGAYGLLHIGIIVNQPKIPVIVYLAKSQKVIIGYDQSLALINCPTAKLQETNALDGMFFEFLWDEERTQVLVFQELGVLAISELGQELWRYTTSDILENWVEVSGLIILTLMDTSASVALRLEDGISVNQ